MQTFQHHVVTQEEGANKTNIFMNKKTTYFLLFVLAVIIYGAFSYTYTYLENKKKALQEANIKAEQEKNRKLLISSTKSLDDLSKLVNSENLNKTIEQINTDLQNPENTQEVQNELIFRKAAVASLVRGGSDSSNNRLESIVLFDRFITSQATSESDIFRKDYAIVETVRNTFQCCLDVNSSSTKTIVQTLTEKYISQGYSKPVANLLMERELLTLVSPHHEYDSAVIYHNLTVITQLLDVRKAELSKELTATLYTELGAYIEKSGRGVPMLINSNVREIEVLLAYAYAYDIYHSFDPSKLTPEMNQNIDKNYQLAFTKLEQLHKQSTDTVTLNLFTIYNSVRYLRSMDKRYGKSINLTEQNRVASILLNSIKSSEDTQNIIASNLREYVKSGSFVNMGYIITLAKKNKEIGAYVTSLGIKY